MATAGLGWAALARWLTHWLAWLAGGLAGNFCGSSGTVPLCLHYSLPGWCTSCMQVQQVEKNDVHRNRCKDGLHWQQAGLRRSGWLARVAWAGLGWAGGWAAWSWAGLGCAGRLAAGWLAEWWVPGWLTGWLAGWPILLALCQLFVFSLIRHTFAKPTLVSYIYIYIYTCNVKTNAEANRYPSRQHTNKHLWKLPPYCSQVSKPHIQTDFCNCEAQYASDAGITQSEE